MKLNEYWCDFSCSSICDTNYDQFKTHGHICTGTNTINYNNNKHNNRTIILHVVKTNRPKLRK